MTSDPRPIGAALSLTESDENARDGESSVRPSRAGRNELSASCIPPTMRVPACRNCGHDASTHRGNRCWVDAYGLPIYRTRSLIDCKCDAFEEDE